MCVMAKTSRVRAKGRFGIPFGGRQRPLRAIVNSGVYTGTALALGRELVAYVIAADLIDLKTLDPDLNSDFRETIKIFLTTPTLGGPASLIECHEKRPNNWGTRCGASRVAVAAFLGDRRSWLAWRKSSKVGSVTGHHSPVSPTAICRGGATRPSLLG